MRYKITEKNETFYRQKKFPSFSTGKKAKYSRRGVDYGVCAGKFMLKFRRFL